MFELTFLGTSASVPLPRRGLSSLVVSHENYRFMVDCGEGTQRQVLSSGLGFRRLTHFLITHPHLDHFLGLAGMISTLAQLETHEKLMIYGGKAVLDKIEDLLYGVVFRGVTPPMKIDLLDIKPGIIFKCEDFEIVTFPVRHRGPDCFGFVFQEQSRRHFLNDRATELGVPNGPQRRDLVRGLPITLADGRIVTPDDVMGEVLRGVKLVITGDMGETENALKMSQFADAIVTEATYCHEDADLARHHGHITAREAATLARSANARHLFLTHISGRQPERKIADEAKSIFSNSQVVRDFDSFRITRDGVKGFKLKPSDSENVV
jgi:ribonuclease Z